LHKHKAVKSAVTHTPATKLFQKVHNVGASATKDGIVFPKNPKDLLNALRDKKRYIYASDHIRIKPEKNIWMV